MISIPFKIWFTTGYIIGGDWRFFWPETLSKILDYSYAWDSSLNFGLGGTYLHLLSLNSYLAFGGFLLTQILHIPWFIGEKILYFWPILFISFFSSFLLSRQVYKNAYVNIFTGILYIFNTYALMIFGGGQVGVALAYSMAPFVLTRFIKLIDSLHLNKNIKYQISNIKYSIMAGLVLALDIFFDLRIAYIAIVAVLIYFLLNYSLKKNFFVFVIPALTAFLLHSFWILPSVIFKIDLTDRLVVQNPIDQLRFFSFADFSHALSLLHPNWPENIFGKTYFMQPEFLVLPILAYFSLLFISKIKNQISNIQIKNKKFYSSSEAQAESRSLSEGSSRQDGYRTVTRQARTILYFCLLGLLGAFLAKGTNEPFGSVYPWFYDHIPGFVMFREPTKFYILVALSYSVLIPFGVYSIYNWLRSNIKYQISNIQIKNKIFYISYVFFIFTILYLIFLIRPIFLGELGGTFKKHEVPKEYVFLKDFLHSQPEFFRTLWIPQWQRFGYFSNNHPAVGKKELLGNSANTIWNDPSTMALLKNAAVKYVIVPYDSEGEIFLNDRKYDNKLYQKTIRELENITWLKKVDCSIAKLFYCYENNPFGKIAVFEVSNQKDHFFLELESGIMNQESWVTYKMINPTRYEVTLKEVRKRDRIIFSESYDKYWQGRIHNSSFIIPNSKYNGRFNSFALPKDGDYSFEVYYEPQKLVNIGFVISGLTLLGFIFCLLKTYDKD